MFRKALIALGSSVVVLIPSPVDNYAISGLFVHRYMKKLWTQLCVSPLSSLNVCQ